jgi:hypothetical protein
MLSRLWAQRYYNYAGILEQSMEARNHNLWQSKDDILNRQPKYNETVRIKQNNQFVHLHQRRAQFHLH